MQNIDPSALAAAKAKLDAAEAQREEVLLRHIANGVDIRSRNVADWWPSTTRPGPS